MPDLPLFHPGLEPTSPPEMLEETRQLEQSTEERRLYAGKYPSVEELERGHENLQHTLTERNQQLAELMSRVGLGDQGAERMNPAERSAERRNYREELAEVGVPPEAVTAIAMEAVQQTFGPLFEGARARQAVVQDYPDFAQKEGEVAQFLEAHPELKQRYQALWNADPAGAMEWAYERYLRVLGGAGDTTGSTQVGARLDAMLPGRSSPASRQSPGATQKQEEFRAAWDEAVKTGNWDTVIRMQLGASTPASHFGGGQR